MIDIPTLADVKKQENELIAKKEAEQLVVQKFFIGKIQKALDNLIDACLEKAKQGEIQFEYQKFVKVFKFYDKLPACVDKDTIYTVVHELRKAGFEVEYEIESIITSDFSYIRSLIVKW